MPKRGPAKPFDALIVGGGPAGLSAAVYLGRARHSVAVVDCAWPGRSDWAQINQNYLGFPEGITIVELSKRGRLQAERFGASFFESQVNSIEQLDELFVASAGDLTLRAHTVILAAGVTDRWSTFPDYEEYIGRSLHWCPICDGYEMKNQQVLVIGNTKEAAEMAIQLHRHTQQVTILTNSDSCRLSVRTVKELSKLGISVIVGRLANARAKKRGFFEAVILQSGEEIAVDHVFSALGARPNTEFARGLGIALDEKGYIKVDTEAKTNVKGIYAAGDITRLFSHQVLTAAHEGATAATSADYLLRQRDL